MTCVSSSSSPNCSSEKSSPLHTALPIEMWRVVALMAHDVAGHEALAIARTTLYSAANQHRLRRRFFGHKAPTPAALQQARFRHQVHLLSRAKKPPHPSGRRSPAALVVHCPPKHKVNASNSSALATRPCRIVSSHSSPRSQRKEREKELGQLMRCRCKTRARERNRQRRTSRRGAPKQMARLGADKLQKSHSLEASFRALRVCHVRRLVS